MASSYQLSARVGDSTSEGLREIEKERDIKKSEAERVAVREGLASMGYMERPVEGSEILLYYVRRIGLILGFVGLILIGYGIFGSRLFSFAGFGLLLTGFVMIATEGFIREYFDDNGVELA